MSQELQVPFRAFNHDRMAFGAFRSPVYTPAQQVSSVPVENVRTPDVVNVRVPDAVHVADVNSVAAVALPATPAPRPAHLSDAQAEEIMESVQHSAASDADDMLKAHNGLDPDRVARLLGLL